MTKKSVFIFGDLFFGKIAMASEVYSSSPLDIHPTASKEEAGESAKPLKKARPLIDPDGPTAKASISLAFGNEVAGVVDPKHKDETLALDPKEADRRLVQIKVSIHSQKLTFIAPGKTLSNVSYNIATSAASPGAAGVIRQIPANSKAASRTQKGCYQPWDSESDHKSHHFNNADMPFPEFYYEGEAVHVGNTSVYSHGCIHVSPALGQEIYRTVQQYGKEKTSICVVD